MADGSLYSKQQRLHAPNRKNPRKFYNHFMFKAIIVAFFIVVVPLFPSEPPDFVSPTVFNRSWELFHLIFVGIAVSYGLFSRKNDADDDKDSEVENAAKIDTAQSYMSRLLHVTSAFDGDDEVEGVHDDHNVKKVETWSSQYIRNEPMLVVADKSCVLDKNSNSGINNGEKPLLLPVRSLKSRVSDDKDGRDDFGGSRVYARSNTSPSIHGFSGNSRRLSSNDLIGLVHGEDSVVNSRGHGRSHSSLGVKGIPGNPRGISRNGSVKSRVGVSSEIGSTTDGAGAVLRPLSRSNSGLSSRGFPSLSKRHSCGEYGECGDGSIGVEERGEKIEESAVLPSPIPWRSRSGRMEMKGESDDGSTMHVLPPSLEESEAARLIKPQLSRSSSSSSSSKNLSPPPNLPSPRKLSSSLKLSAESQAKSVEDYGRWKSNYSSHVPPPPPPPPPFPTTNRSRLVKSRSSRNEEVSSSHKDLKRTVRSEPKDFGWQNTDESFSSSNEGFEIRNEADCGSVGKSVRTARPGESRTREVESPQTERPDTNSAGYSPMTNTSFSEYPKETRDFLEQVLLETDDESEGEGENYREEKVETTKVDEAPSEVVNDEGPDVDKKADEFIAKFREQIRLQRIESIKKSTGQLNRSFAR